jgi:hypothetical protein
MMRFYGRRLTLAAGLVLGITASPAMGQVLEPDALQRKQEDQQRARTMTRELLGGVLDIQLRQLEENGLADQEIYRDIRLMRRNLNHLVETEMSNVVDLLAEAQRLPKENREASFVEARQQIRRIVRQLAVERQNLLKRLKIAELAEQVRRLIRQQVAVQTSTRGLPAEPQTRQESLTLKAIEDQRDVKELFLHLVDTMVDMKSWSGMLATAAADGLRILKAADVGKHLDGAGASLQRVKYEAAVDQQEQVLRGLKELLKVIERAQGTLDSGKMAAIDKVRAIADKQQQLRDETKTLEENQQPSAELVEQQAKLEKNIARLQEAIRDNPKAETHIQQAETAALDAATALLDQKLEQALSDQGRVLGNLAALEATLKDQARQPSKDKSANELAQAVKELGETKLALSEAQKKQVAAETKSEHDAQSAAADETSVAEIAQQAMDKYELSGEVEAALADVASAASDAGKNLAAAKPEKAAAVDEKAIKKAGAALDRAIDVVDAALSDAGRQESAVKIGELARAAEVLERAAAEERAIARESESLARADAPNADENARAAKDLAGRQDIVKAIADKAAEGLAQTSAEAAKNAAEGSQRVAESAVRLQAISDQKSIDVPENAKRSAQAATAAAQNLAAAAKEIRKEIVATASQLSKQTAEQAAQLATARAAVESAVDRRPSIDKMAQLEAARDKLGEAMQEQAKAQGKPAAAAAMELASQIATALDTLDAATAAAAEVQSGIGSELKATALQEEVAEKSQAAADRAAKRSSTPDAKTPGKTDELAHALNAAQQAAATAAKQTLDGDRPAAEASRQAAESALKRAFELARVEAAASMTAMATTAPDPQAQAKAATATEAAQSMAAKASTPAGTALAPAVAATEAARQTLATSPDQAAIVQSKASDALKDAATKLDAAIRQAATEQALSLASQSKEHSALADHVARVDPAAADAIDAAARATKTGSEALVSPRQMAAAANRAELALEHAAADLSAKEQDVRRDQAIAESIASLARDQQTSVDAIAEQASSLERMADQQASIDTPAAAQQAAAQKLNDAQQQFAQSQRATGQGAVELSGQTEVANQPLREALELASSLPSPDLRGGVPVEMPMPGLPPTAGEGDAAAASQPAAAESSGAGDHPAAPADGQGERPAEGQSSQGKPASGNPHALGTGFVPQSPQLTAEMMAGPKAQQAAQKALGSQLPLPQQPPAGQPQSGQPGDAKEGESVSGQPNNASKLTKKDGAAATNQKVKDGPGEKQPEGTDAAGNTSNKTREKEEGSLARQLKEEAWFAKLPPELRKSIRAGAAQKPPRAYEERLKKYFQSVD